MVDKSDIVGQSYGDGSRPWVSRVILMFLCRKCLVKQIHQYMGGRVIVFTVKVWNWNISSCWWLDRVACPRHEGWTAVIPRLINPQIQPPAVVRNLRLLGSLFLSIVIHKQRTDSRDWVLNIHCSWRPRFCPRCGVSLSPLYVVHAPVWRDSVMGGLVESNATSRTPTPHAGVSHPSIRLDCSCMTSCNSWSLLIHLKIHRHCQKEQHQLNFYLFMTNSHFIGFKLMYMYNSLHQRYNVNHS